ncbi:MAG: hypothetical protein ACPGAO_03085 [Flavobacteriaceae bacterium]
MNRSISHCSSELLKLSSSLNYFYDAAYNNGSKALKNELLNALDTDIKVLNEQTKALVSPLTSELKKEYSFKFATIIVKNLNQYTRGLEFIEIDGRDYLKIMRKEFVYMRRLLNKWRLGL